MKILFLSTNNVYGDYITDALMYGLIKAGHEVIDIPKRQQMYKNCAPNYFTTRGYWHCAYLEDRDINRNVNSDEVDLIIMDTPKLYNEDYDIIKNKVICLLTNDPITRAPMPNIRAPKGIAMAIKEKCLQSDDINIEANDFNINHTVDEVDCKLIPFEERREEVFMSMSIYGDVRKELSKHFTNQWGLKKEDYFNTMRKYKYGISVMGEGYNCQRDPELGGNTLLCKYKHPNWKYDETSYTDGVNCIEFSSVDELKEKMAYYNTHPDEYNKLLKACYEHTIKYLTHKNQAERLIEWMKEKKD